MADFIAQYGVLIASLLAAGVAAGIAAGLFGIGGGAVIVPVLYFLLTALGYESTAMHVAVATSLATIILTSIRSVMAHNRRGAVSLPMSFRRGCRALASGGCSGRYRRSWGLAVARSGSA